MRFRTALLACAVLCLLLASPLYASAPYTQRDTSYFFRFDTGPFLVEPGSVVTGPDGTVAVWDEGLQQYFFLPSSDTALIAADSLSDTGRFDTGTTDRDDYRLSQLFNEYHQSKVVRRWGLSEVPTSFFGADGRLWSYSARRSTRSGTVVLQSTYPNRRVVKLPGPIRSIVPSRDQWLIQLGREDTPLVRWDPYSDQGLVDTAPYRLKGTLIGVTRDGRYLTRHNNEIRTYREGKRVESRTFSTIKDLAVKSNNVYVLTGNREITRLDSRLTAQYTFFLPRRRSYHSLAVTGDTVYLTSPEGLFSGVMDETGRSFFSQSSRLPLTKEAGRFPIEESSTPGHRLWVDKSGTAARLLVKSDTSLIRSFQYQSGQLRRRPNRSVSDLSRTAFQYFQVDATYWRGEGNLYYFFENDNAVEQYDTEGRLIKRRSFVFDEFKVMRNVSFLGADTDNVYFSAELIDSRRGFQQFVLHYDWQGNLIRSFRLQHPFSGKEYMAPTEGGSWRYLGGENFYQLHSNSVMVFDRYGYPRQTISDVSNPVDLARSNGTLFVLDLGGKRLRAFEVPDHPTLRLGLPSDIRIGDLAAGQTGEAILSGLSVGEDRLGLYEYDLESYDFQQVLSHPKQSLRYPLLADDGDSLFFWGRDPSTKRWTLYNSDTVKYSARPLKQTPPIRGTGFFSRERGLLFYPIESTGETAPRYHYTAPFGDTAAHLGFSDDLIRFRPGGFTGYYGVKKTGDTYTIVSGYLDRKPETGPLHFMVADTLYQSSNPIVRIIPGSENLYFASRPLEGFSRLGRLSTPSSYSNDYSARRTVIEWLGEFRGYVSDLIRADGRYYMNLQTRNRIGRLYHFYPGAPPGTGGLQGRLTSSDPRELSDITLRIDPGGQLTKTEQAGRFSFSAVPSGYVEIDPPSYRNHFAYPIDLPIHANEYTVKQSIPMAQQQELLLLDRGIKYFDRGSWNNARIPIEAFRELVQDGPYYRWTDAYMEVIYRQTGDTRAQFELFKRRPELFSAPELLDLYRKTSTPARRRVILETFRSVLDPYFRTMVRNEVKMLAPGSGSARRRLLNRPLLSTENRTLPQLSRPIRKSAPE